MSKRRNPHKRKKRTKQAVERDAAFASDLLKVASLAATDTLRVRYGWNIEQIQEFQIAWIARMQAARD